MHKQSHTHTKYNDRCQIVLYGKKRVKDYKCHKNAHIITIFLIDCVLPITMQYICIAAGEMKLRCDVFLTKDFIRAYSPIRTMHCQYTVFLFITLLCRHACVSHLCFYVYNVCLCLFGRINYFSVINTLHTEDQLTCKFCTRKSI